jgi:hypothetical protein
MIKFEPLQQDAAMQGILLNSLITVVSVQEFGSETIDFAHEEPGGDVKDQQGYPVCLQKTARA